MALALSLSACGAPANTNQATPQSSETATAATAPETTAAAPVLSVSDQFAKDVMVSKPLDLSGLTMPDDVKSKFPDGGAGVPQALEKYIAAATYPELQKGSHLNTVADYPLFENLRPLTTPTFYQDLLDGYASAGGTAMIPNYVNGGEGLNDLSHGHLMPDDNGPVWQWGNEKATARYLTKDGVDYVGIKIPVRFSFNTTNGKGVVSIYASRQYGFKLGAAGQWLLSAMQWSASDTRSSTDPESNLTAASPIDGM
jgi:hypothetical protein